MKYFAYLLMSALFAGFIFYHYSNPIPPNKKIDTGSFSFRFEPVNPDLIESVLPDLLAPTDATKDDDILDVHITDFLDKQVKEMTAKFAYGEEILIRTRIVIETNRYQSARTSYELAEDLHFLHSKFKQINVRLVIHDIVLVSPSQGFEEYIADAQFYPNYLSIYYVYDRSGLDSLPQVTTIAGMARFPWSKFPHGIVLRGIVADRSVLAHEFGHYAGLLHTFTSTPSGDYVDDTYSREEWAKKNPERLYSEYLNLMNYTSTLNLYDLTLTDQQLQRAFNYLMVFRGDAILNYEELVKKSSELRASE